MIIRDETPADIPAITAITQAAFAPQPFSSGTEGPIIARLRERGELTLSLVAEEAGEIVGHAAFSPVTVPHGEQRLFALGPISVRPDRQRSGIGGALIHEGLARLKALGARGCVLVGDPGYYGRFGFEGDCGLTYQGLPERVVQALVWEGAGPEGEIGYASGFAR